MIPIIINLQVARTQQHKTELTISEASLKSEWLDITSSSVAGRNSADSEVRLALKWKKVSSKLSVSIGNQAKCLWSASCMTYWLPFAIFLSPSQKFNPSVFFLQDISKINNVLQLLQFSGSWNIISIPTQRRVTMKITS